MLIITRKVGEKLIIGDDVELVTLGVQGGAVKIGIKAPQDVSVHREEIYNRIKNESDKGANSSAD